MNQTQSTHYTLNHSTLSLHVVELGAPSDKPALVFLHGWIVDHREWLAVAQALPEYRCLLIDLPGHGQSSKPAPDVFNYTRSAVVDALVALSEQLKLDRFHLLGHSYGASLAIQLAALHPDRVAKLVLADSMCFPMPIPFKGQAALVPKLGEFIFKYIYNRTLFREYFIDEVWNNKPGIPIEAIDAYYENFKPVEARLAALAMLRQMVNMDDFVPLIGRVQASTLIIWGEDDRLVPLGLGHRLSTEIKHATLKIVKGCGHAPNEAEPQLVADYIRAHLTESGLVQPAFSGNV